MEEATNITLNRNDRRKNRTRRQLMEAAIDLLVEHGYEDLMTDAITDRADVGRRTFYNHFVNKRDCVVEAAQARFRHYANALATELAETAERDEAVVVAIMARRVFQDIAGDPVTERLMHYPGILGEAIAESQRDYVLANLARGLATNRLRPVLPLESMEPLINWSFLGLVIDSIRRDSREQDSLAWAHFVLHSFSLDETEIQGVLDKTR